MWVHPNSYSLPAPQQETSPHLTAWLSAVLAHPRCQAARALHSSCLWAGTPCHRVTGKPGNMKQPDLVEQHTCTVKRGLSKQWQQDSDDTDCSTNVTCISRVMLQSPGRPIVNADTTCAATTNSMESEQLPACLPGSMAQRGTPTSSAYSSSLLRSACRSARSLSRLGLPAMDQHRVYAVKEATGLGQLLQVESPAPVDRLSCRSARLCSM